MSRLFREMKRYYSCTSRAAWAPRPSATFSRHRPQGEAEKLRAIIADDAQKQKREKAIKRLGSSTPS